MKTRKVIAFSAAAMLLAGCGNKSNPVQEQAQVDSEVITNTKVNHPINATAWIYRGNLGDRERVSVELLEKTEVNAAVTFQYDNTMFTIDNVYRSREIETYRYESGDTVLALHIDLSGVVKTLAGTVQFGDQKYEIKMPQEFVSIYPYPINRYKGVPDSLVAVSVRDLQQIVAAKDIKKLAALCEWPVKYHGRDVADEAAFIKLPLDELFSPQFVKDIIDSYDYFFYLENEMEWYCLAQGCMWFVVKSDGSLRVKSINIPLHSRLRD